MIKINFSSLTLFEEIEEEISRIFENDIYINSLTNKEISYKDISYENYFYVIGTFIKCFRNNTGEIFLVQDLMGNSGYAYMFKDGIFTFGSEFLLYREVDRSNKNNSKFFLRSSGFVKGSQSAVKDIYRFSSFSEICITNEFINERSINLSKIQKLLDIYIFNYMDSIKKYINRLPASNLLYSGGADSNLIYSLNSDKRKINKFFGYIDRNYESSRNDLYNIVDTNELDKTHIIEYKEEDVLEFLESNKYRDLVNNFTGYSHSIYTFYLTISGMNLKSGSVIVSGQGADTVGYFGPSESLFFNSFLPRNITPLIARIKILFIILSEKSLSNIYWLFFNDENYTFNNNNINLPEESYLELLLPQIELLDTSFTFKKILVMLIAKIRGFGSGNDFKVQLYISSIFRCKIYFPFNNIVFFLLSYKHFIKKPLKSLFIPKYWYAKKKHIKLFRKRLRGTYKSYKCTNIFKKYLEVKNHYLSSID